MRGKTLIKRRYSRKARKIRRGDQYTTICTTTEPVAGLARIYITKTVFPFSVPERMSKYLNTNLLSVFPSLPTLFPSPSLPYSSLTLLTSAVYEAARCNSPSRNTLPCRVCSFHRRLRKCIEILHAVLGGEKEGDRGEQAGGRGRGG